VNPTLRGNLCLLIDCMNKTGDSVKLMTSGLMAGKGNDIEWLKRRTEEHRLRENDVGGMVDDFDDVGKLGRGLTVVDALEEINLGTGGEHQSTFVSVGLNVGQKEEMRKLLEGFMDCFVWEYTEIPGLSRELVEYRLPIKKGFQPYKQPIQNFSQEIIGKIKEEVDRLLKAGFVRPCRYAEWVSNVVPVEQKNIEKIRVCVDFRNLNMATPKDEYPMPVADSLINNASGNRIMNLLDGNAGYNQIFMVEEDISKTAFHCPGFVGLFEWVVMTFGLKNAGATYQRAMNLIFHDLLGASWRCILTTWW
jgi:hypothetical protein